jgi:KAP family P-loop domain
MKGRQFMPHGPVLFLNDEPLDDATLFNADRIVNAFIEVIKSASHEASMNICISGGWGSGKTTILRTLLHRFSQQMEVREGASQAIHVPLWFDPWKLSTEAEVRDSLVHRIMELVESDADFLSRASIAVDRKNIVRLLSERLLKVNADQLSTFYRFETRTEGSFEEVEDLFRRIATAYLNDSDIHRRLIVFVDDLDRCRPSRVVEVLEAVKLFFDLPGIVFIFGLDRDQVESAIAAAYGYSAEKAKVYLEKIFQLTFVLPQKGMEDLSEFVTQSLSHLDIDLPDRALARSIVNRFGRNLRNLKLFMNSFSLQRLLVREAAHQYDDELLFKWLYLETTMPRSLTEAIRAGSLDLVVAFEFLAFGGMLYDARLHNRYISRLRANRANLVSLVALAMLPKDSEMAVPSTQLPAKDSSIFDALCSDGEVAAMLGVLREGRVRLLDEDLRGLALLTRLEEVATTSSSSEAVTTVSDEALEPLDWGGPLNAAAWDARGDRLRLADNNRAAYVAYLMAVLSQPDRPAYIADLAKVLRPFGRLTASKALLRFAYQLEPNSIYVLTELSYFYDIELGQKDVGTLMYWKAIAHGNSTASVPGNLSMNLAESGDADLAYLSAADAYFRDHSNEKRLTTLIGRSRALGRAAEADEDFESRCRTDLDAAIKAGRYPRQLTTDEENRLEALIMSHPLLSSPGVIDELSRPPL